MMSITPTASPQPLPGASKSGQPVPLPGIEDPQGWLGRKIATFDYTWQRNGKVTKHSYVPGASFGGLKDGWITTKGSVFQSAGESFQDAVKAANELSRESYAVVEKGAPGKSTAFSYAVLQARDGAWYTTALRDSDTGLYGHLGETNDPVRVVSQIDVTPLTPALKAVVGMNTWVNFTDEDYVPTFVSDAAAVKA